MYSTILSQRASLLSAPTLNPINCSGGWSEPGGASTRRMRRARGERRDAPEPTSEAAGPARRGPGVGMTMSKDRPALRSETTMRGTSSRCVPRGWTRIQAPIVAVDRRPHPRRRRGRSRSARASCTTGRRAEAIDAVRDGAGRARHAPVPRRRRPAGAASSGSQPKLRGRERHRRRDAAAAIMVTAGANMAFMHAVLATTIAGRRGDPAGAVLFQPRDGDRDGRLPRRPRADRRALPAARRRDRARDHDRARAPSSRSRRTIRAARCSTEASLRARQRALPRARRLPLLRRAVRVLHLRRGASRVARVVRRARRITRSRCTRCRRPTGSPAGGSATWSIRSTSRRR